MAILDTSAWGTPENDPAAPQPAKAKTRTGFIDGVKATWAQESIWEPSQVRSVTEYSYDAGFDYKTYDKNDWPLLAGARNKEHAENILAQANKERANKEIMDNQHWALGLGTSAVVGLTNPLNYIGVGKAATLAGAAAKGAAGAVVGTALTEPLLHANQVTRTLEDSAYNVAGAALLGAPLGAAGKLISNKLSNGSWTDAPSQRTTLTESIQEGFGADSISAARARTRTADDAAIADSPWLPKGWMEKIARFSYVPGGPRRSANQRLQTSDLVGSRNAAQTLVSNKLATGENAAGVASDVPLEFSIRQNERTAFTRLHETDEGLRHSWWTKVENNTYDPVEIVKTLRELDPNLPANYKVSRTTFDKMLKYHMADVSLIKDMPEVETRAQLEVEQRAQIDADKIDYGVYKDKSQLIDITTGERVVKPDESKEAIAVNALRKELDELKQSREATLPDEELRLLDAKVQALAQEMINPEHAGDKVTQRRIREAHAKLSAERKKGSKPKGTPEQIEEAKARMADLQAKIKALNETLAQRKADYDALIPTSKTHRFAYEDGSYYLSRAFDKGRITANRDGFQESLIAGWAARNSDVDITDPETYLDLKMMAEQVTNKLLNEEYTVSMSDIVQNLDLPGKYTKGRTLNLDDRYLVNWTHDDALATQMRHLSQSITDIEMAKRGIKFADLINNINEEVKIKTDEINLEFGVNSEKAMKAINALQRTREKDINEIEYIIRRLKRKAPPSSSDIGDMLSANINRLNSVAGTVQLGSSAIPNSLGDVSSVARVMGTGNLLKAIGKTFSKETFKEMVANAKELGILTQQVDNVIREQQYADMLAESLDPNKGYKGTVAQHVDRGIAKLQQGFAKFSLVEPWAKAGRVVATESAKVHILKSAQKGWGNLNATTRTDFAKFFIDEDMMQRIAAEAGNIEPASFKVSDLALWQDQEAARIFRASIYGHVEQALNIPSIGTGSQFMTEHGLGQVLMRYQSFNMASHESMFLASLQNGDATRLGIAAANYIAINFMSLVAYDTLTSRDTSWEKYFGSADAVQLTAWKILLRGGFVAAGADGAINILKIVGHENSPVAEQLREWFPKSIEDEVWSKYADVDTLAKLAGPTYGYAEQVVKTGAGLMDGEWDSKDVSNIRKILPGQNIGWLRGSLDYVEELLGGRDSERNGGSNLTKDVVESFSQ